MSTTRQQKRPPSRSSVSSASKSTNNRPKSQSSTSRRTQSPKSTKNTGKRVQIGNDSYFGTTLSPMAPGYLNRRLIKPWRRTDKLDCTETQIPISQIWVQSQQQMYELQALAKSRGDPDPSKEFFKSPYPQ